MIPAAGELSVAEGAAAYPRGQSAYKLLHCKSLSLEPLLSLSSTLSPISCSRLILLASFFTLLLLACLSY